MSQILCKVKLSSQNHRLVQVGETSGDQVQPAWLKNQLEQVAQDVVQSAFEHLQRWILLNLSEQPVPGPDHSYCKKVLI